MKNIFPWILFLIFISCKETPQQAYKGYPSKEGAIDIKEDFPL